jgi:hypothetical protein
MTTPTPAPVPVPAPHHGIAAWFEDHVIPGFREALADAEKARTLIPALEAWLPKLEALAVELAPEVAAKIGPLVAELQAILAAISSV